MNTLLLITIFLPLVGAALISVLAQMGRGVARSIALAVTVATLVAACVIVVNSPAVLSKYDADGDGQITQQEVPASDQRVFDLADEDGDGVVAVGQLSNYALYEKQWLYAADSDRQGVASAGPNIDVRFSVALDGLGLWLFGLSALLMVTCVLVSWKAIEDRAPLFYAMLLSLEFGCLGVFTARDIILFYVFFEFTLIPLFFLIGIWGSDQRRYAAAKFFLFTLAGSVLTFLGLLAIVIWNYAQQSASNSAVATMTFSIPELTAALRENPLPWNLQMWIFAALFAGFAIKVPLFPLHTWLPLAHTEAPTAGSVFLAGIMLKIGTYGFLRFSIPMLPAATVSCMPYLLWLSVIGILYGALVALAQKDIKRLIAYSSVSHLGFCTLGLFALNRLGLQGGALQMINHGISTGALFALVGMLYERYHTREISRLGGLARRAPWLAFFMVVFTMSSIGLPGMNGFAGEFLLLLGMFQRAFADESQQLLVGQYKVIAVLSVLGVVLGAWYMLWLVQRVFFGPLKETLGTHASAGHASAGHASATQYWTRG